MNTNKRNGSLVMVLGLAALALAGCGEYRWLLEEAGKHGSGKPDPAPGSGGGAQVCVDLAFDHDVACLDIVDAKDQAGADCQKRGLELNTFAPGTCIAGDVLRLKYSCCPKNDAPPPPAPACLDLALGHDVTCEDATEAKDEAWADCRKRGFKLTALEPGSCVAGDVFRLNYTCCP